MVSRKSLSETVTDVLLDYILDSRYPVGSTLPTEADIASDHGVSRVTVREAVKTLQASNVVTIRRGVGTFVNDPSDWTSLKNVVLFASRNSSAATAAIDLIEIRRMVETGAACLAAVHRTDADLLKLEELTSDMERSCANKNVTDFVRADIQFHEVILHASHNLFVPVLFEPLGRLLYDNRMRTSSVPQIQKNAIAMHRGILEALTTGDPENSRLAMNRHMDQTVEDLQTYILRADDLGNANND